MKPNSNLLKSIKLKYSSYSNESIRIRAKRTPDNLVASTYRVWATVIYEITSGKHDNNLSYLI